MTACNKQDNDSFNDISFDNNLSYEDDRPSSGIGPSDDQPEKQTGAQTLCMSSSIGMSADNNTFYEFTQQGAYNACLAAYELYTKKFGNYTSHNIAHKVAHESNHTITHNIAHSFAYPLYREALDENHGKDYQEQYNETEYIYTN